MNLDNSCGIGFASDYQPPYGMKAPKPEVKASGQPKAEEPKKELSALEKRALKIKQAVELKKNTLIR
jgi:hypothetical protein